MGQLNLPMSEISPLTPLSTIIVDVPFLRQGPKPLRVHVCGRPCYRETAGCCIVSVLTRGHGGCANPQSPGPVGFVPKDVKSSDSYFNHVILTLSGTQRPIWPIIRDREGDRIITPKGQFASESDMPGLAFT